MYIILLIAFTLIGGIAGVSISRPKKYKCPSCGYKQAKYKFIKEDVQDDLAKGRRTKSGKLDQRFNTNINYNNSITYGIECEKCGLQYEYNRDFEKKKIFEKQIDNDPVIKALDKGMAKLNRSAADSIRNDPDALAIFKKHGIEITGGYDGKSKE